MPRTIKIDWFNNFLAEKGAIVSGHPSFGKMLGVNEEDVCVLRFVDKDPTLLIILTIEVDSIGNFGVDILENHVFVNLNKLLGESLFVLVFDKSEVFSFYDKSTNKFIFYNHTELEEVFKNADESLVLNKGTNKAINKSTNDNFQTWTRQHLTRNCVVNDIDALLLTEKGNILYELKRVSAKLYDWMPYLDDYSNYKSFLNIARRFKFWKRLVAYTIQDETEISFHFNLQLDPARANIMGEFIIMAPQTIIKIDIGKSYTSTYTRHGNN